MYNVHCTYLIFSTKNSFKQQNFKVLHVCSFSLMVVGGGGWVECMVLQQAEISV